MGTVTVVAGEDYDFATVNIAATSSITAVAAVTKSAGSTITITSSVVTAAGLTQPAIVVSIGSLSLSTLGNQIHDVAGDPYRLQSGDYTWDAVGAGGDWDNWPDNVWGNFDGVHVPITLRTATTGGFTASGLPSIIITSAIEAVTPSLTLSTDVNITTTSSVSVLGGFLLSAQPSVDSTLSVAVTGGLLIGGASTLNIQSSVSALGQLTLPGNISIPLQTGFTVQGNHIFTVPATIHLQSQLLTMAAGTLSGIATIGLGTVVVSIGSRQVFDRYRAHLVDSESRAIAVIPDSRIYIVDSQTRTYKISVPPLLGTGNIRINI